MTRNLVFSQGEYYHIYNRGTDKRNIFQNKKDYDRFLILLYLCNNTEKVDLGDLLRQGLTLFEIMNIEKTKELVHIGAYCLMPNHFHLLVLEKEKGGASLFMQKLQTAYTMYFNKKYDRSGSLFQGTFKAKHISEDNYLKYLFAYIHLNPVKLIDPTWKEEGISNLTTSKNYLKEYSYSSFLDFIGIDRQEKKIINISEFPEYFDSELEFKDFLESWLEYNSDKV